MAKRVSRRSHEQILMQQWGVRLALALALIGLAYGFASLAIDSGNLLEYAAAIACIWYGFRNAIRAFRLAFFN